MLRLANRAVPWLQYAKNMPGRTSHCCGSGTAVLYECDIAPAQWLSRLGALQCSGAAPSAVPFVLTPSPSRGAARSFSSAMLPTTPVVRCDDMTDGKGSGLPHIRYASGVAECLLAAPVGSLCMD